MATPRPRPPRSSRRLHPRCSTSPPASRSTRSSPTADAIRYEAQATTLLGLVLALLATAFVGQTIARQSRREWADGPMLRAVGVTTGQATASAALRSLSITVPAAVLGIATAIVLSPRGPVGIGRRAEVDPGIQVDTPVLALGALAVLVVGVLAACVPLARGRALRIVVPAPPRRRPHRSVALPPVVTAGLYLSRTGRGRGRGRHHAHQRRRGGHRHRRCWIARREPRRPARDPREVRRPVGRLDRRALRGRGRRRGSARGR